MCALANWHLCGACFSVTDGNSQPDPKGAQLPFTKEYSSRRRLAKDLRARGEMPLCFHPKFIFLGAISGLFSAAYQAWAESHNFIYFYSCFMNIFFLSVMRIDPALAQQDRVEALVQTPSSHSHGITAMVFFSGECRGSVTPPTLCKSELHRAQGMWKGPGLYCDSSPSLYHDQYSWILLLKEAFLPSGGKWRVQAKAIQCHFFASNMYVAFLFAKPCISVFGWKHSVGMLNSRRQRMAHLGGMHNPSSRFSLCSSILEFWMQGGNERSWKGKEG